jgi:DNA-binding transcriptional MerR regulator
MMIIKNFKKDINNSLEEIQEIIGKQVEALKEETQKSLKEFQKQKQQQQQQQQKTPQPNR